jgi:DNA repair protein SbcD/Mre11
MKFIHAADLHIDSPMRGLAAYEGAPVDEMRSASRRALRNLARTALEEQVDLVVLAGDVFDGDWPDYNTGLFFISVLTELTRGGIKVVVLAGNHDADSKLTRHLTLPNGAFKLDSGACETLHPEQLELDAAVHGHSYATRAVTENLCAGYPEPVAGVLNIGVLHTALNGRPGHDPYAPCTPDQLVAKGYDYWALGHIHQREIVATDPWVVFPGNLQGRHARETGAKGFTLVTVEDGRITEVEHRDADVARWIRCEVDASPATSASELLELVTANLGDQVRSAGDRIVAARVVLNGVTDAHDELHTQRERFEAEVRAHADGLGQVWVEKVRIRTHQRFDRGEIRERDDAVGTLFRTIKSLRDNPDQLVENYAGTFANLSTKLPSEAIRDGADPQSAEMLLGALEDAESLIAELLAGGSPT